MKHGTQVYLLLLALAMSNLVWAVKYHQLWLDDAQANAWLDWDQQYMQDFQIHEQNLLMIKH